MLVKFRMVDDDSDIGVQNSFNTIVAAADDDPDAVFMMALIQ